MPCEGVPNRRDDEHSGAEVQQHGGGAEARGFGGGEGEVGHYLGAGVGAVVEGDEGGGPGAGGEDGEVGVEGGAGVEEGACYSFLLRAALLVLRGGGEGVAEDQALRLSSLENHVPPLPRPFHSHPHNPVHRPRSIHPPAPPINIPTLASHAPGPQNPLHIPSGL